MRKGATRKRVQPKKNHFTRLSLSKGKSGGRGPPNPLNPWPRYVPFKMWGRPAQATSASRSLLKVGPHNFHCVDSFTSSATSNNIHDDDTTAPERDTPFPPPSPYTANHKIPTNTQPKWPQECRCTASTLSVKLSQSSSTPTPEADLPCPRR